MISYGLGLAVAATVIWAFASLLAKVMTSKIGSIGFSLVVLSIGIIPTAAAMLVYPSQPGTIVLSLAVAAGVFLAVGYLFFLKSLRTVQASDTYATTMLQSVMITVFGIFALGEAFTTLDIFGSVLILAGVLFVSMAVGFRPNRQLVPAVFGNISWAVFWIIAAYVIALYGNIFPFLTYSRLVAALIVVPFFFAFPPSKAERKASRGGMFLLLGVTAAMLSGFGNMAFGLLTGVQLIAVGSMITTLSPLLVVILAHFVLKERLAKKQVAGVLVATVGAMVMVL